jgi:hypothetical protein
MPEGSLPGKRDPFFNNSARSVEVIALFSEVFDHSALAFC